MPAGFASNRYLEFNPQCDLPRTVASVFRCLGGVKHTERCLIAYIRRRRRVVGTVQHVGERRLEAQTPVVLYGNKLCQACTDRDRTGRLENSDARIANSS